MLAAASKVPIPPPSAPRAMAAASPHHARGDSSPTISMQRERDRDYERGDRDRLDRGGKAEKMDRTDRARMDRNERIDRNNRGQREWKMNHDASATVASANVGLGERNTGAPGSAQTAAVPSSLRERIGSLTSMPSGNVPPAVSSGRIGGFGHGDNVESRKRTLSDRDRDALLDSPLSAGNSSQAPKRPRIVRNRYGGDQGGNGVLLNKALGFSGRSGTNGSGDRH